MVKIYRNSITSFQIDIMSFRCTGCNKQQTECTLQPRLFGDHLLDLLEVSSESLLANYLANTDN